MRGDETAAVAQDTVVPDEARSPAKCSFAARSRVVGVSIDLDTVDDFSHLDRQDIRLAVAEADETAFAILIAPGSPATGVRLDQDGRGPVSGWMVKVTSAQTLMKCPAASRCGTCGAIAFQTRSAAKIIESQ